MGINVGGNIKTENLVFGYDTGFGVVTNHLTTFHYKGEPTTNQYDNPIFVSGTSSWTFGSWDGNISYTTETTIGPYGEPISALKLSANTTSAYSHFHQSNGGKYTTGNLYTLSAWVKGKGTIRGRSQWGDNVAFTLNGQWQYISYTVTAPNTSNYPYWAAENLTNGTVCYFTYAQSEQKSHATPFVNGTRSATESLYDLSGNHTIDMSNMVYDSTGQPIQNYGSTYITPVNTRTIDFGSGISVDIWYKNGGGTGYYRGVINNGDSAFRIGGFDIRLGREDYYGGGNNGSSLNGRITTTSEDLTYSSSTSVYANPNEWHNYTLTYDNYTIRWYKDGEFWGSLNHTAPGPIVVTGNDITIGVSPGTLEYLDGQLASVKVYDLQLSAEEVQQNYNSTKGRFGL